MTVRVATSDQTQSLTRSLSGSTTGSRKDGDGSSFGGVLSTVAGDHAASGQAPNTTADKDGTGKATAPTVTPNPSASTALAAGLDSSLSTSTATGLLPIVTLASDTAAAWTIGAKAKGHQKDGAKADPADAGSSTAQTDPGTPAAGLQQASLLALVQSAAATPPSSVPDAAASAEAVSATTLAATGAMPSDSNNPKDVSTPSLVSDVTFQTYLSPVTGSAGRIGGGKQTTGSIDPATASSSKAGSPTEATTVAPAPDRISGAATAGDASDQDDADSLADSPAESATAQDGTAPASGKSASVETTAAVSPQAVSAAIDVSGATLPAPLRSVADAVVSLASQSSGSAQPSADPSSRVSPARTMLLQLNPGELGTVSVRLHLTGRTLDVSLSASKDQTANLLDQGRDTLTRAIGDQDYQINSLVVQRSDLQRGDATSLPGSSNASTDTSRDQGTSYSGGGDASGGGRQGADGSPARQDRQPAPSRPTPGARGTGLFL